MNKRQIIVRTSFSVYQSLIGYCCSTEQYPRVSLPPSLQSAVQFCMSMGLQLSTQRHINKHINNKN